MVYKDPAEDSLKNISRQLRVDRETENNQDPTADPDFLYQQALSSYEKNQSQQKNLSSQTEGTQEKFQGPVDILDVALMETGIELDRDAMPQRDWEKMDSVDYIKSFGDSFSGGAQGVFHSFGTWLKEREGNPEAVKEMGKLFQDITRDPEYLHPKDRGMITDDLASGMGSMFSYITTGFVTGKLAAAALPGAAATGLGKLALSGTGILASSIPTTTLMAGSSTGAVIEEARAMGWEEDQVQEMMDSHFAKQFVFNFGLNILQAGIHFTPVTGLEEKVMKQLGGGLLGKSAFVATRMGAGALEEAVQETGMTLISTTELGQEIDWKEVAYGTGMAMVSHALTAGLTAGVNVNTMEQFPYRNLSKESKNKIFNLRDQKAEEFRTIREQNPGLEEVVYNRTRIPRNLSAEGVGHAFAVQELTSTDEEFRADLQRADKESREEIINTGLEYIGEQVDSLTMSEFADLEQIESSKAKVNNTAMRRLEIMSDRAITEENLGFAGLGNDEKFVVSGIINNALESDSHSAYLQNRIDFLRTIEDKSENAGEILSYYERAFHAISQAEGIRADSPSESDAVKMAHLAKGLGAETLLDTELTSDGMLGYTTTIRRADWQSAEGAVRELSDVGRRLFEMSNLELEDISPDATSILAAEFNPSVIAHEVGHVVDQQMQLSEVYKNIQPPSPEEGTLASYAMDQEIIPVLEKITDNPQKHFRSSTPAEQNADAVALFLRFPDLARQIIPDWVEANGNEVQQFVEHHTDAVNFEPTIQEMLPIRRATDDLLSQAEQANKAAELARIEETGEIMVAQKTEEQIAMEKQMQEQAIAKKQELARRIRENKPVTEEGPRGEAIAPEAPEFQQAELGEESQRDFQTTSPTESQIITGEEVAEQTSEINWDRTEGMGNVPDQMDIDHFGYTMEMTPEKFRSLVPPGNSDPASIPRAENLIDKGEPIAPPVLKVKWDEENAQWIVEDHEGRSRSDAAKNKGAETHPVDIIPAYKRSRNITPAMKSAPIVPQGGGEAVDVTTTPVAPETTAAAEETSPQSQERPNAGRTEETYGEETVQEATERVDEQLKEGKDFGKVKDYESELPAPKALKEIYDILRNNLKEVYPEDLQEAQEKLGPADLVAKSDQVNPLLLSDEAGEGIRLTNVKFRYALMSMEDYYNSMDPESPGAALQERVNRAEDVRKFTTMEHKIQPSRITFGTTPSLGAPIIDQHGLVVGGHLRSEALRVWLKDPEVYETYKDYVQQHADTYGLNPDAMDQRNDLVVVRQVVSDLTPKKEIRLARLTNVPEVQDKSNTVFAMQVSDYITPETLALYNPTEGKMRIASEGNTAFAEAWSHDAIAAGIPASTINEIVHPDTFYSRGPIADWLIKYSLFARAFDNIESLETLSREGGETVAGLLDGISRAAPQLALLRAKVEAGEADPNFVYFADNVVEVIEWANVLKKKTDFNTYDEWLAAKRKGMFELDVDSTRGEDAKGGNKLPILDTHKQDIFRVLDKHKASPKRLGMIFSRYAEIAQEQKNIFSNYAGAAAKTTEINDMFSEKDGGTRLTVSEVFARAVAEVESEYWFKEPTKKTPKYHWQKQPTKIESVQSSLKARMFMAVNKAQEMAKQRLDEDQERGVKPGRMVYEYDDTVDIMYEQIQEAQEQFKNLDKGKGYRLARINKLNLTPELYRHILVQGVETVVADMTNPNFRLAEEDVDVLVKNKYNDFMNLSEEERANYKVTEETDQATRTQMKKDLERLESVLEERIDYFRYTDVKLSLGFLSYLRNNAPRVFRDKPIRSVIENAMAYQRDKTAAEEDVKMRDYHGIMVDQDGNVHRGDQVSEDARIVFQTVEKYLYDSNEISDEKANKIIDSMVQDFDALWPEIEQQRGLFSFDQALGEASGLQLDIQTILNRIQNEDENLNPVEMAWLKTMKVKKQLARENLREDVMERMRQGEQITQAERNKLVQAQKEVEDYATAYALAGSEAGRSLAVRKAVVENETIDAVTEKMPKGLTKEEEIEWKAEQSKKVKRATDIEKVLAILEESGAEITDQLREDVLMVEDLTDETEFRKLYDKYSNASWRQWVEWLWVTNVLSGPRTHGRNTFGAGGMLMIKPFRRLGEAMHQSVWNTFNETNPTVSEANLGDFGSEVLGTWKALPEAWANAKTAFLQGVPKSQTLDGQKKIDFYIREPLSKGWGLVLGPMNRFMLASDQFFRTLSQGGAIETESIRAARALQEKGEYEHLETQELAQKIKESPDMVDGLKEMIEFEGAESVLQQNPTTKVGKIMVDLFSKLRAGEAIEGLPHPIQWLMGTSGMFMRTGVNMAEVGYKMTPGLGMIHSATKALKARSMLSADETKQAESLFKSSRRDFGLQIGGMFVMAGLSALASSGAITGKGPDDWEERSRLYANGWQPYSVMIPGTDKMVSYRYMFPFNFIFATAAHAYENVAYNPQAQSKVASEKLFGLLGAGFSTATDTAHFAMMQSVFYSLSRWWDAISGRNVRGTPAADPLVGFIPYVGLTRTIAQWEDPRLHQLRGVGDVFREPIPLSWRKAFDDMIGVDDVFGQEIPTIKNRFGKPIEFRGPLGSLSPFIPAAVGKVDIDIYDFRKQAAWNRRISEATAASNKPYEFDQHYDALPAGPQRDYITAGYIVNHVGNADDEYEKMERFDRLQKYITDDIRKWIAFHINSEERGFAGSKLYDADRRLIWFDDEYLTNVFADRLQGIENFDNRIKRMKADIRFLERFKWGNLPARQRQAKIKSLTRSLYRLDQKHDRKLFRRTPQ